MTDLITITNPRSPVAEAYRSLRTNLDFASLDQPLHSLVITSPGPEEGKSTTLANLAVTAAEANKRVILVDCDLRRPRLHEIFGLENDQGLTSMVVSDQAMENPPLQEVGVERLRVLTSGPLPPNPADLLASRRMDDIIKLLVEQADLVLFDAPPVIAVTDAAVLASKADGALLLIGAGNTRREHAQQAKEVLERVNARLVGAVLIGVPFDPSLHRYYAR